MDVTEALRINPDWDERMWQPDRDVLVLAGYLSPGIERRHFRSTRYGRSPDYGENTHVFRDDRWIGQVKVSTSTLGSPSLSPPGGQIARWRDVSDALLASLTVRPSPTVSEALAELRVQLTLEGLNPRLVGKQLHLSLVPPKTPLEVSGIRGSYIWVRPLSRLALGPPDEVEQATTMAFAANREVPGNRVIAGSHCRGVIMPAIRSAGSGDQAFLIASRQRRGKGVARLEHFPFGWNGRTECASCNSHPHARILD